MAITTLDGLIAGLLPMEDFFKTTFTGEAIGLQHSSVYIAGRPGAMAACAVGVGGEALTSCAGQIPFPAAVGGKNVYLARIEGGANAGVSALSLMDRLWQNSELSVTSIIEQDVNSAQWPARDRNGSTDGAGVMIALEVSTILGVGTPTLTIEYTNSEGTGSRTGTIGPITTSSQVGTFHSMTLQAGDVGVRSVQHITSSATMTSGAYQLVAYRSICMLPLPSGSIYMDRDGVSLGLPRLYDNSVPFLVYQLTATAGGLVDAGVIWAQG